MNSRRCASPAKHSSWQLVVYARTVREYGCLGYGIITTVQRPSGRINVQFSGVRSPSGACATALGPALSQLDMGVLANDTYPLVIGGSAGRADLLLEVSSGAYGIVGRPDPGLAFDEIELRRIPDRLVWGYFGYSDPGKEPVIDAVLAQIAKLGGAPIRLAGGKYAVQIEAGWADRFRVSPSGVIERTGNNGYRHLRSFAVEYFGDRNELRDLVASVGDHDSGIHLQTFTWKGDLFSSWTGRP